MGRFAEEAAGEENMLSLLFKLVRSCPGELRPAASICSWQQGKQEYLCYQQHFPFQGLPEVETEGGVQQHCEGDMKG